MKSNRFTTSLLAASLGLALAAPLTAQAADAASTTAAAKRLTAAERDARQKGWTADKDELEKALGVGHDKAYYRQSLEKAGYHITAINRDSADALEYEVVKGQNTYEVQVGFDKGVSKSLDVTTNLWKAPNTKAALANKNWKYTYPSAVTANADRVRDKARNEAWVTEKGRLEKELGIGHDRSYYRRALEKQGYRVTSINEADAKNLEYEIVKGDSSYEVQIDFDENTKKSTRVGVSTNLWDNPGTDSAKGQRR